MDFINFKEIVTYGLQNGCGVYEYQWRNIDDSIMRKILFNETHLYVATNRPKWKQLFKSFPEKNEKHIIIVVS